MRSPLRCVMATALLVGSGGACDAEKCEQVIVIGRANDLDECAYKRMYFDCLRLEGCYYLQAACPDDGGGFISCKDLCAADPGLETCRDPVEREKPEENFHLCPHRLKNSFTTAPPGPEEYLGAPSVPFTLTIWTAFEESGQGVDPFVLLPALWPSAVRTAVARHFGFHPPAVVVQLPVTHLDYLVTLDADAPAPPQDALYTTFVSFGVHVIDPDPLALEGTRLNITTTITGSNPTNLTGLELDLVAALRESMPANAGLSLTFLSLYAVEGIVDALSVYTSTSSIVPQTTTTDPSLARQSWRAWRIRCLSGVVYHWEVRELEFWLDRCPWDHGRDRLWLNATSEDSNGPREPLAISSGEFKEAVGGGHCCGVHLAFDVGGVDTSWASSCKACAEGEAWIGVDGLDRPFTVACAVVRQSKLATNRCYHIGIEASDDLVAWNLRTTMEGLEMDRSLCVPRTKEDYPLLECGTLDNSCRGNIFFGVCEGHAEICEANKCRCTGRREKADARFVGWQCGQGDDGCGGILDFGDCPATDAGDVAKCVDHHCKDSEFAAVQWRVMCAAPILSRWWIREIEFHTEGLCYEPFKAYKATITSGSRDAEHNSDSAFDDDLGTYWISQCFDCAPGEAWIGLDFGTPVRVACVKLMQGDPALQQCAQVVLEYSDDGTVWRQRHKYGFGDHALKTTSTLLADMDTRFNDSLDLGALERLAPLWRVLCVEEMRMRWGVKEVVFFDDEGCASSLRGGIKRIIHSLSSEWMASNAFDQKSYTLWKSRCGRCSSVADCDPCMPGQAFIGVEFQKLARVRCLFIEQLDPSFGGCPSITLQFSMTGRPSDWIRVATFKQVGAIQYLVPRNSNEASTASSPRYVSTGHGVVAAVFAVVGCALLWRPAR
mmetsp:Transcript_88106/g.247758  ORF Transcript_88106/g.247758 Transcript_88106/m.247758 type:complete len:889 (-) Transcript_88106:179-2845(-)